MRVRQVLRKRGKAGLGLGLASERLVMIKLAVLEGGQDGNALVLRNLVGASPNRFDPVPSARRRRVVVSAMVR